MRAAPATAAIAPPGTAAATLSADGVALACAGTIAARGLHFETRGGRVLLVGDSGPLMDAIMGTAAHRGGERGSEPPRVVSGTLTVLGCSVAQAEHHPICGMAPLDCPLPGRWTTLRYLMTSARLGGARRGQGAELAHATLQRLQLSRLARRRLRTLEVVERRQVVLAAAAVLAPEVVVLDRPLAGLDAAQAAAMLATIALATRAATAILSTERLAPQGPSGQLARGASDMLLMRDGELLLHAGPELLSRSELYALTVCRGAEALQQALSARGLSALGGPEHFVLELPPAVGPSVVLAAAAATGAAVVRCTPLW